MWFPIKKERAKTSQNIESKTSARDKLRSQLRGVGSSRTRTRWPARRTAGQVPSSGRRGATPAALAGRLRPGMAPRPRKAAHPKERERPRVQGSSPVSPCPGRPCPAHRCHHPSPLYPLAVTSPTKEPPACGGCAVTSHQQLNEAKSKHYRISNPYVKDFCRVDPP